jgi:putative membrane protein
MLDLDLVLAILHHFFVFALFAVFFAELVMVRHGMEAAAITRVAAIDAWYGVLAGLILIVGFARAIFAAKGWDYYAHNVFFWAKIGTFLAIALLSVPPTLAFLRWRRTSALPTDEAVAKVRPYLWLQMALFPLLPAFAAAMARGYGELIKP